MICDEDTLANLAFRQSRHEHATNRWPLSRWASVSLVAALFITIAPVHALAFRTSADDPSLAIGPATWRERTIPLSLTGTPPAGIAGIDAEQALLEAWATWELAGCAAPSPEYQGLSIGRPASSADGVVTVQFLAQADWDARSLGSGAPATTVVSYISDALGPAIVDADVFVNAEAPLWATDYTAARRALLSVLVHEIGHILGLLHTCELDVPPPLGCVGAPLADSPTMHPLFFPDAATLASDDTDGACFLYPTACDSACAAGFVCSAGACVPGCATTVCGPDDGCTPGIGCEPVVALDCPESCRSSRTCLEQGDPCMTPCECLTQVCADGVCALPCTTSTDCDASETCNAGACETYLGTYGDGCTRGLQCATGLCLLLTNKSGGTSGSCTRACLPDGPCPAGAACSDIDGLFVCYASTPPSASGCAIADPRRRGGDGPLHLGGWAAVLFAVLRMRSRRAR